MALIIAPDQSHSGTGSPSYFNYQVWYRMIPNSSAPYRFISFSLDTARGIQKLNKEEHVPDGEQQTIGVKWKSVGCCHALRTWSQAQLLFLVVVIWEPQFSRSVGPFYIIYEFPGAGPGPEYTLVQSVQAKLHSGRDLRRVHYQVHVYLGVWRAHSIL